MKMKLMNDNFTSGGNSGIHGINDCHFSEVHGDINDIYDV